MVHTAPFHVCALVSDFVQVCRRAERSVVVLSRRQAVSSEVSEARGASGVDPPSSERSGMGWSVPGLILCARTQSASRLVAKCPAAVVSGAGAGARADVQRNSSAQYRHTHLAHIAALSHLSLTFALRVRLRLRSPVRSTCTSTD